MSVLTFFLGEQGAPASASLCYIFYYGSVAIRADAERVKTRVLLLLNELDHILVCLVFDFAVCEDENFALESFCFVRLTVEHALVRIGVEYHLKDRKNVFRA